MGVMLRKVYATKDRREVGSVIPLVNQSYK